MKKGYFTNQIHTAILQRRIVYAFLLFFALLGIVACNNIGHLPEGKINSPQSYSIVSKTILCTGSVQKTDDFQHYWLVVSKELADSNLLYWPKEPELVILDDGSWSATIFEDGFGDSFSISLYALKDSGQTNIHQWLETGSFKGSFAPLTNIPYSVKLDMVEALQTQ